MQRGDGKAACWLAGRQLGGGDLGRRCNVVECRPQLSTGVVHVGDKLLDVLCGRLPHVSERAECTAPV